MLIHRFQHTYDAIGKKNQGLTSVMNTWCKKAVIKGKNPLIKNINPSFILLTQVHS